MKHTLGDKEFQIVSATARAVIEAEKKIGRPIASLKDNPSYEAICQLYCCAIIASDDTVNSDWVLDNMKFSDMEEQAQVVAHFLEVKTS